MGPSLPNRVSLISVYRPTVTCCRVVLIICSLYHLRINLLQDESENLNLSSTEQVSSSGKASGLYFEGSRFLVVSDILQP
jgi:hypothetical protein